jgi:hypothetical protein
MSLIGLVAQAEIGRRKQVNEKIRLDRGLF